MPEGTLELARQGSEVLNRGDVERFVTEFVHPDYEFHTGVRVPSIPSVVQGRGGLRDWIQQWYQEPWEGQLQIGRIEQLDDGRVLALLTLRARAAAARRRWTPSTRTSSPSATGCAFAWTATELEPSPGSRRPGGLADIRERPGGRACHETPHGRDKEPPEARLARAGGLVRGDSNKVSSEEEATDPQQADRVANDIEAYVRSRNA